MPEETAAKVLVVDDELSICKSCQRILERDGFAVKTVLQGSQAVALLEREPVDLVFTDLKMAEMGGMELLEVLGTRFPDVVAVVLTGYATIASVVETMKLGAHDYLPKPFTPDELSAVARKAWEKRRRILESKAAAAGRSPHEFQGLIGKSQAMQDLHRMIQKVAPTSSTVLIMGDTGTGKELVARAVHRLSPRGDQRFFAVDCGTLSVNLLESELFGHARGAFTGAVCAKQGIFELADRGTVFLDEICNVDLEIQGKLLRFIQEREFLPVGGSQTRRVDVRLIFATNRDLEKMVAEGTFREDLYYRLYVFPIRIPPLRERPEDVPLLAFHLLSQVRERSGKRVTAISDGALRLLEQHDWPGNVRQLESVIERAAISCDGEVIEPRHLPRSITHAGLEDADSVPKTNEGFLALKKRLREQAVSDLERDFVLEALRRNGWNVSRAAREVGLQRPNFQALMRKHDVHPHRPA